MIEENLPLVAFVLSKMSAVLSSGVIDREDAHSYGVEGLIQAVDHYDPEHGAAFSTFALLRIRGAILDAVRRQDALPRSSRKLQRQVEGADQELAQRLGRWPSVKEVALFTGLAPSQVLASRQLRRMRMVSLEHALSKDPTRRAVLWDVEDLDEGTSPDAMLEEHALKELLEQAIASLPARDRRIIELRYRDSLPISGIGRALCVSDSRISQLHKRILAHLRQRLLAQLDPVVPRCPHASDRDLERNAA
jgi:RNA polymerase sigma factor for flagellar operon FliA